nr:immunoglobulin heavy chain junction region [Mus musculus]MBK4196680.1 immunoglobulin heavy chain junction region [Mus musculus]
CARGFSFSNYGALDYW